MAAKRLQFDAMKTNERTHSEIKHRKKWTNLKHENQIIATNTSSSSSCATTTTRGRYKHLQQVDDDYDNRFRMSAMQMPSTITNDNEWPRQQKQRLGCLLAGRRGARQPKAMRPIRLRFNGGVSLSALVIGLLHQIVIVSLVLSKLPALKATRTPLAKAGPSYAGDMLDEPTTMTFNHNLGNNRHNFNQQLRGYSIEMPELIYPPHELLGERAGQKTTSEQQQRQQRRASLQTKEPQATNDEIGNNQRQLYNQQDSRSFIKTSELADANQLPQTAASHEPQRRHQFNAETAAAAGDNDYQRHGRRAKRHLGAMFDEDSVAIVADAANQYVTAPPPPPPPPAPRFTMTNSKRTAPDCHKLAALWLYLQSRYPTLAGRLVELASGTSSPRAGQHLTRSIGQILDDAERLTAAVTRPQQATASLAHRRHSPAWLARISPNSAYGKLVQNLRAKQLNQLNHQQLRPSSSSSSSSGVVSQGDGEARELSQRQQPADLLANVANDANDGQMASSTGRPQLAAAAAATTTSQVEYGRVFNYPHELRQAADNSERTLNKLRLLGLYNKQRQQQLESGDIVETNKIPLTGANLADQTESEQHKLDESAIDRARNTFVYGTILLSPSDANDQDKPQRSPSLPFNQHHNPHHHRPLSALRELAREQEHQQQLMQLGSQNQSHQPPAKTAVVGSGQNTFPSSDTNYGQIPPSDNKHSNEDNDKSDLRQTKSGPEGDASATDELVIQRSFGLAAAEGGDGEAAPSNSDDEFEGEFHSSPLKQAEVRLLRSLDHQQQRPSSSPSSSSSSSSGAAELKQQPQVESVTRGAEFVID